MNLIWGTITQDIGDHLLVSVDGREGESRAIAYPDLVGPVTVGDRVLLNTTAVDLKLGTGGDHFVVARIAHAQQPEGIAFSHESGGHLMKLRYTPLQRDVISVEAPEATSHRVMQNVTTLENIPVVCCGLHSQLPIVAATIKAIAPHLRVGYVMTDQAALHLGYSRVIKECTERDLIDMTVSAGQAMGGEYEAINLYSGLLAACHVGGCDIVIVAIGPGVAGTSTPFGHGGVAQGEAINAVAALKGRPVATLRMSFADARERHQGISHHTITALEAVALAPAIIPIPAIHDQKQAAYVESQLDALTCAVEHYGVFFEESVFNIEYLGDMTVTTMGRCFEDDPVFFEAAAASGAVAAQIASCDASSSACGSCESSCVDGELADGVDSSDNQ